MLLFFGVKHLVDAENLPPQKTNERWKNVGWRTPSIFGGWIWWIKYFAWRGCVHVFFFSTEGVKSWNLELILRKLGYILPQERRSTQIYHQKNIYIFTTSKPHVNHQKHPKSRWDFQIPPKTLDPKHCFKTCEQWPKASVFAAYRGWTTTQLYRGHNKPWNKDPGTGTNQEFMGTKGFDHC